MKFLLCIICLTIISCHKPEKKHINTRKLINVNSAKINICENKRTYLLQNCTAEGSDENLIIKLNNYPSESDFELLISKDENNYKTEFNQTFSVSDSSYKKPEFKIIEQNIFLNKSKYKKGDILKGNLKIGVLAHYTWEKDYFDTIRVTGSVNTIVK